MSTGPVQSDLRCWYLIPVIGGTFVGCQRPTGHEGAHAHTDGEMVVVGTGRATPACPTCGNRPCCNGSAWPCGESV